MNISFILIFALTGLLIIALMDLLKLLDRQNSDVDEIPVEPVLAGKTDSRKIIITHTDFDGFACGALLYRWMNHDAGFIFTSARRLRHAVAHALGLAGTGDMIVISDLALPFGDEPFVVPLLQKARSRGVSITWFDHHQWPAGLRDRIGELVSELVIDTAAHTAAEMIRLRMPPDDEIAERIIRFLKNMSFPQNQAWDKAWRAVLTELSQLNDHELSASVLQTWASGDEPGTSELALAIRGLKRENKSRMIAGQQHRISRTQNSKKCLVLDLRKRRLEQDETGKIYHVIDFSPPGITTGMLACRHHEADFCVILWQDFRYSIYRGIDRTLDFKELFPGFNIGAAAYQVSGHDYAASVRVMTGFLNKIKMIVRWRAPVEFENFLDYVLAKM